MKTEKTIPDLKSIDNLRLSQWIYNNFDFLSKKKKKRKMLLICIIALLFGFFNGVISSLEENLFNIYDSNKLRYLIVRCVLGWDQVSKRYEKWVIKQINLFAFLNNLEVALIMDDVIVEKDNRSTNIVRGGKRGKKEGFSLLTAIFVVGDLILPLIPQSCFRNKICLEKKMKYIPKTTKALNSLKRWLTEGIDVKNTVIILDSWYSSSDMINFCENKGLKYVFGIKCDRNLNGKRVEKYKKSFRYLKSELLSKGNYNFWLSVRRGKLNNVKSKVNVLLSKRMSKDGQNTSWRYFVTNISDEKAVFNWIRVRWQIETFHQIFKYRFKPENWRFHGTERIARMLILTTLAIGFAVNNYLNYHTTTFSLESSVDHSMISEGLNFTRSMLISNREVSEHLFRNTS